MAGNIRLIGREAAGGLVASLLVLGAGTPPAAAQCEMAELLATDGAAGDQFGTSVSISGNVAVVGARTGDGNAANSGSAYVFRWTGSAWVQQAKLTASDGAVNDLFGRSVSISGDVVVIGAPFDDDNGIESGSAYLFQKPPGGWVNMTQTAKLTASDGATDDFFAVPVSISGDVVVVGAYADDDNGSFSGSVYVFQRPPGGWVDMTQTAKLTALDGAVDDFFGLSVSISGEVIVVGANGDDDNGSRSGSAYVYVKPPGGWVDMTQTAKLTASDGAANDTFGWYVSIRGDVIVIGANSDADNGANTGSAYVFQEPLGGWVDMTQTAKLTASDGAANDFFGESVSISGDVIVVGAHGDDDNFSLSGSAYVYVKPPGGWVDMTQTAKLTASDGAVDDLLGFSMSISGGVAVAGAYLHDDNGSASGSAYVFGVPGLDCNSTGQPDACDIFLGVSRDTNANLIPDECESPADITGPGGVPDGCVDAFDLGSMLGAWCSAVNDPNPPSPPCENCTPANLALADISGAASLPDGCVDAFDLAKLLADWCSVAGGNPCGTCQ